MTIKSCTLSGHEPVVEVATFDGLLELAKKYESMVLEYVQPGGIYYLVWDDGMLYRYSEPS